jgi:hypothetical protein
MTKQILNINTLDISRITVSKPKDVSKDGMTYGKRVYLQYNDPAHGSIPLVITLPKLKNRYGLTRWDSDNGQVKFVLNSHFEDFQATEQTEGKICYEQFCKFETRIKELLTENSIEFFGGDEPFNMKDIEKMKMLYPVVKRGVNKDTGKEYPPSIKMNFPRYANNNGVPEFSTKVFLKKNSPLVIDVENPSNTIPKYSDSKSMAACSLFISKATNKVSLTMNATMVKVYPAEQMVSEYNADWDSDTEESSQPQTQPQQPVGESSGSDTESSSESEPDTEPEEAPAPPPKKRNTRKVKLPA